MGLTDKLKKTGVNRRRKSLLEFISPNQVTENSLQIWRGLPQQIRQDPSWATFRNEDSRLHGPTQSENQEAGNSSEVSDDDNAEFINMKDIHGNHVLQTSTTQFDDHGSRIESPQCIKHTRQRKRIKKVCLIAFWLLSTVCLVTTKEKTITNKQLVVDPFMERTYVLPTNPTGKLFKVTLEGYFKASSFPKDSSEKYVTIYADVMNSTNNSSEIFETINSNYSWVIPIGESHRITRNHTFHLSSKALSLLEEDPGTYVRLRFSLSNAEDPLPLTIIYDHLTIAIPYGTLYSALILTVFYALLVWEVCDKTFTAVICSIASLAVLAVLGDRPGMDEIISWIDIETLTLLFCMMILIAVLTETGVFDYLAVLIFEVSSGKIWPLIYCLNILTCIVSSMLDNVTTVLLMTPVSVRLCEVMELDPVPVIIGIIVHSNIGAALTPIGDPISIIISTNSVISKNGVHFMNFVKHTLPGVFLVVLGSCAYLRCYFWDIQSLRLTEPKAVKELKRQIKVWTRAAHSLSSYSKDVDIVRTTLLKKVKYLKHKLKQRETGVGSYDEYSHTLEDLKAAYPVKNKPLLVKATLVLALVIIAFFVQSVPSLQTLPLGWVALIGVILLLVISGKDNFEELISKIEWTTLLFIAAMYVVMECVERLGLISWIGTQTKNVIMSVDEHYRLAAGIFLILWISALGSAVLDSLPVTAMMVRIVVSMVHKEYLTLPIQPLVWALTFGACLGGNGTLYGSSANVISAGIAEQHGYKITFWKYFKIAFPMMIGQVIITTGYLVAAHIIFKWH